MSGENDQREKVLNRKCSKRNFEQLTSFDSVELLSDLSAHSVNKRSKVLHSEEKGEDNFSHESCHIDLCQTGKRKLEENPHEIVKEKKKKKFTEIEKSYYNLVSDNNEDAISNCLNEFATEEPNQQKQNAFQLNKNGEYITPPNTAIRNDELSQQDEELFKGTRPSQLAIIPFEGECVNSVFNCTYDKSSSSSHGSSGSHGNRHMGSGARDRNDVKNIFHMLSKKDIFYKNLIKNQIKNNKPIMIKCDNLSLFLNRNNYGGNAFPNELTPNANTSHLDEGHAFANAVMPSSSILQEQSREQNLHHFNDEQSIPLSIGSFYEDSPTTAIKSNNGDPILNIPNNAQAYVDTPSDGVISNINISDNAMTKHISCPYPSDYPPDIENTNDGSYFAPDKTAQNNEACLYNQPRCTNFAIPDKNDNLNPTLMRTNQNNSESIGHVNSLSDVGNYYQANDYNAYQ
ncbi:hypothetical protein AK88_04447 [Plasmodium fragile]|uniref:Uncharacterized protein n=1 Tax=Plasmodium fragile TaxID=5857 RepID=A0A0D9QFT3_PLAFR|nr:uncharacterized protein AK88_04447 [Plasmodium fragile]KJP85915.1 hypothetical protein AK88_04447 [Plasmodium fragile]